MKTFDEKDLITWVNRHDVKVGDKGYFGHSIAYLKANIKANHVHELVNISDETHCCFKYFDIDDVRAYGFFLPVDAVKEEKYRPCKTIQELYELVTNLKSKMSEEECVHELLGTPIYFRGKYQNEFYAIITQINIIDSKYLLVLNGAMFSFKELFNNYEIEINGEWLPFGVLENEKEFN